MSIISYRGQAINLEGIKKAIDLDIKNFNTLIIQKSEHNASSCSNQIYHIYGTNKTLKAGRLLD